VLTCMEMENLKSALPDSSGEVEYLEKVKNIYKEVTSIPTPCQANVTSDDGHGNVGITVKWKQQDLATYTTKNFNTVHLIKQDGGSLHMAPAFPCFPIEVSSSVLESVSPSLNMKAVIHTHQEAKAPEKQYICEIWDKSKGNMKQSINLSKIDAHGIVHSSIPFKSLQWSPDETKLLYIAEKKKATTKGYFDRVSDQGKSDILLGEQNAYEESWGELNTDVCNPVICILDLEKESIEVVDNIPSHISPAEAVWGPNGTIVFVGIWNTPFRLGVIYCMNRKSAIFVRYPERGIFPKQISGLGDFCVSFPRMNPSMKDVVFLQRRLSGRGDAHLDHMQLAVYNFQTDTLRVSGSTLPFRDLDIYLYTSHGAVPEDCWLDDGRHICLPTIYEGESKVCVIDTETFKVQILEACSLFFGTYKNLILTSFSTMDAVSVNIGCIAVHSKDGKFGYDKAIGKQNEFHPDIMSGRLVDTPNVPKSFYIMPKNQSSADEKFPLIVWPHGGPHSVITYNFSKYAQGLARAGFACLLVNYKGSIGFDENVLHALPGHIGDLDVRNVQSTAEHFLQKFEDRLDNQSVYVFGGSHGGFLTAQLIGQYPDFYKAAVLRNPVIDVSAMASVSDIPDWCYFECGLSYSQSTLPTENDICQMLNKSPIVHAANIKAPVMLMIGGKDLRVPPSQGKFFYNVLRAHGKTCKLHLYPEDSHPLSKVETEADVFMNVCKWFHTHK